MKSTQEITQEVQQMGRWIPAVRDQIGHVVVGQKYLVDRLLLGLLANGHILLEGVPGLAKTLTVKTMAACIQTGFQRLQFTPDLLPADLIGTLIYNPRTGEFTTKLGPLFSNLILADEINRAPAKVQSALLEAMQERQVTIGETTYPLSDPFLVLATQNPLEQEGTYQLPEAQLDLSRACGARTCIPQRPRLRHAAGREEHRHGCASPSRHRQLRSRSGIN